MKPSLGAVAAAVIGSQSMITNHLLADDTADTINGLKQQIEQLDQKVRILERNRELEKETADTKPKDAPKISIGEKGFSFGSAAGNFAINLRGVLQLDSRTFFKDGGIKGNDGFLLRRARPIIEGIYLGIIDHPGKTCQRIKVDTCFRPVKTNVIERKYSLQAQFRNMSFVVIVHWRCCWIVSRSWRTEPTRPCLVMNIATRWTIIQTLGPTHCILTSH